MVTAIEQRYVEEHPECIRQFTISKELFPNGVTHDARTQKPFPYYVSHAASSHKWDIDGQRIIDYKTGKAPPERYALQAFFALKIYALLIRIREGRTPATLKLIYLNGPTVYEIPVNDHQLDAIERQLTALWTAIERAIENDRFPTRTGPLCDYCAYQDICPAFATED